MIMITDIKNIIFEFADLYSECGIDDIWEQEDKCVECKECVLELDIFSEKCGEYLCESCWDKIFEIGWSEDYQMCDGGCDKVVWLTYCDWGYSKYDTARSWAVCEECLEDEDESIRMLNESYESESEIQH